MKTATLRLATYNLGPDTDKEALARVDDLMDNHEIVGLTETGAREPLVRNLRRDYTVFYSTHMNEKRIALVLNRDRFTNASAHWFLMNEGGNVGPGAGPDTQPDRYMLWSTMYDTETRRHLRVAVKHLVASQQNPKRDDEAEEDIRRTCLAIDAHPKFGLFILGDFNAEPDHPNLKPLRTRLLETAMVLGRPWPNTFGKRHIDHCWYRARPYTALLGQRVIPENPADHDAYSVRFEVTVRPRLRRES